MAVYVTPLPSPSSSFLIQQLIAWSHEPMSCATPRTEVQLLTNSLATLLKISLCYDEAQRLCMEVGSEFVHWLHVVVKIVPPLLSCIGSTLDESTLVSSCSAVHHGLVRGAGFVEGSNMCMPTHLCPFRAWVTRWIQTSPP